MAASDFAVFVAGAEKVLPPPTSATWQRLAVGETPTGATVWSLHKAVTWQWATGILADADWANILAAIATDGTCTFRTRNDAEQMVVCTGKADRYPATLRFRGQLVAPTIAFARVVES